MSHDRPNTLFPVDEDFADSQHAGVTRRKPWSVPRVIVGEAKDAETNGGATGDTTNALS